MSEERIRSPYRMYRRLESLPMGRWLFTRLICFRAPYFSSIRPLFRDLSRKTLNEPRCQTTMVEGSPPGRSPS